MMKRSLEHSSQRWRTAGTWFLVWLAFATLLVGWRWEILDSPPYWDAIFGLWMEANFLDVTDFDYSRLRYGEKHGTIGGAYSYMTSVMPTLLAISLRIVGNDRAVFILYHLFNIGCAAAIGATVWVVLRRYCGNFGSVLAVAALLTTPVFSAQIDMASMELPLTLAVLLSAVAAWREHWKLSVWLSFGAYLVKQTGMLLTAVNLLFLTLRYGSGKTSRSQRRRDVSSIGVCIVVLILDLLIVRWGGTLKFHLDPRNRPEIAGPLSAFVWFPEVVFLYAAFALASLTATVQLYERILARRPSLTFRQRLLRIVRVALRGDKVRVYCWLFVIVVLVATTRIVLIPRYILVTLPFFYIVVGRTLSSGQTIAMPGKTLLFAIALFNLFNQYGAYYPSIAEGIGPQYARTGAMLERSREYLADHRANIEAMRMLERLAKNRPIFAGHPFVYALAIPRMGYVSAPLRGFALNEFSDSFPMFINIRDADVATLPWQPIFVKVPSTYYFKSLEFAVPDPVSGDSVLYDDAQHPPLVIFEKSAAADDTSPDKANWYLQRLLPWATPEERARAVASYFRRMGDKDSEIESLSAGLDDYRPSESLAAELAEQLLEQGRRAEAITVLLESTPDASEPNPLAPFDPGTIVHIATEQLRYANRSGALELFDKAVNDTNLPVEERGLANLAIGVFEYHRGSVAAAEERLRAALHLDARLTEALIYLGLCQIESGRYEEARIALDEAVEQGCYSSRIDYARALIAARTGDREKAKTEVESALHKNPGMRAAQHLREQLLRSRQ